MSEERSDEFCDSPWLAVKAKSRFDNGTLLKTANQNLP